MDSEFCKTYLEKRQLLNILQVNDMSLKKVSIQFLRNSFPYNPRNLHGCGRALLHLPSTQ